MSLREKIEFLYKCNNNTIWFFFQKRYNTKLDVCIETEQRTDYIVMCTFFYTLLKRQPV